MADKYIIRVTAGSDYNIDHQVEVPVNSAETTKISNDLIDAEINVRVKTYHGLPRNSPTTSPYFSLEPHISNNDQYSLAIRFTPKRPVKNPQKDAAPAQATSNKGQTAQQDKSEAGHSAAGQAPNATGDTDPSTTAKGISGHDLQFGNDFDHAIRDRLPPGFSYAMNIVKWWIDPGLDGDPYADMPYLYGPGLSSFNAIHVGQGDFDAEKGGLWFEEGGDEAGMQARHAIGAPDSAKDRKKWGLNNDSKDKWIYEYGKTYCVDFFNPYLDFNDFALRLPGFTVPIMKYWDGQGLRYVLRNRSTNDTYLVILFTLYLKEDVNEDGSLKPAALEATHEDKLMAIEAGKMADDGETAKAEPAKSAGEDDDVD